MAVSTFFHSCKEVLRRRLRGQRRRKSWSFLYELVIEQMRNAFLLEGAPPLDEQRKSFDGLSKLAIGRRKVKLEDIDFNGVTGLWLKPVSKVQPGIILYLHGGGYVIGSTQSCFPVMLGLARATGFMVLGCNYRKGPEDPCPAAIDDVLTVYQQLLTEYDSEQIVLAGDSAGGGLAVASMVAAKDEGLPLPHKMILLSPWTDLTNHTKAAKEVSSYDHIFPSQLLEWSDAYAGTLSKDDPRVSPLFADLSGLPPMLILTGELELFIDENILFAQRARAAGVQVTHHIEKDEIHDYIFFSLVSPRGRKAFQMIRDYLLQG